MLDVLLPSAEREALAVRAGSIAAALLARSETGLVALDSDLRVVMANEAARALLGLAPAPLGECGDIWTLLATAAELDPGARRAFAAALRPRPAAVAQIVMRDGRMLQVESMPGPDGHMLMVLKPRSPNQADLPQRDGLTGLANRQWFMERLAALADGDVDLAVLMIDLDRFKMVNDSLGHSVGDALLQLVAKRLGAALRGADVIARFGGDEFAVAMIAPLDPESVGRRVADALSRPYLVERTAATIGASVGIAVSSLHGKDAPTLIRAAELALGAAKELGSNSVYLFDPELDRASRKRHSLAEDLRRAIPLGQLELHYQPQMNLVTRTLTGFEALVRWRHPEHGLVQPDSFIPLAEEIGAIWPLGEWVLRQACRDASRWPADLTVAVNVSPRQLTDPGRLLHAVRSTLESTGFAPNRLEIEITETALVCGTEALDALHAIRDMGVRVSMDDFGTGYSSLSQLRKFSFDKLKIDRSFVRDLGASDEAAAVIRAIAALGNSLGMTTIAEGVETEEQAVQVQLDGCTEMQGYLLSRPVPAAELNAIIERLGRAPEIKEADP